MSTGQISSRVGDSASNPAENSSNTVQTVAPQDEIHISSFVNRANTQVEAAIAHYLNGYAGSGTPESSMLALSRQIQNIISLTFTGSADITPDSALPVFVQLPGLVTDCLHDQHRTERLLKTILTMRNAAENDPQFTADIYTFDQVAYVLMQMIETGRGALNSRLAGISTLPSLQPEQPSNTPKPERFYDAVKHSNNEPVTISSDAIFFEMLTNPENLASFIENISGWFAMWANSSEKWAGNPKTSAGDYSVIMEFLGRMVVAVADHDAQEDEIERLRTEKAALVTESKWLAKTLDKTRSNLEALKAGVNTITELQTEVDRLRTKYESSADAQKGGQAK